MRKKLFNLSRKERDELERRYKQERDRRVAERIQCIILLHDGKNAKEVAETLLVSKKTIKRWIKAFVKFGIEGLCKLKHGESGAELRLNGEQVERLEKHLQEQIRSTKEVMDYIEKEFGIKYSESGVFKLLKRLGYSYKKPQVVPAKADPEKQAAFVELYKEKKREFRTRWKGVLCRCLTFSSQCDSQLWMDQARDYG